MSANGEIGDLTAELKKKDEYIEALKAKTKSWADAQKTKLAESENAKEELQAKLLKAKEYVKKKIMTAEQALKYARLSDGGDPRSVAAMGPKPALNLVLTGAQVDDALAELEAIERDLDVGGLAGAEREDAERRVKALRAVFAKRSL